MTDIMRHFKDTIEYCKESYFPVDKEICYYIYDNGNRLFPNDKFEEPSEIVATIFITPHWWNVWIR